MRNYCKFGSNAGIGRLLYRSLITPKRSELCRSQTF
jgi:hypothetical protein